MTPPAPRAVVFDLDGTLLDSMPLVLRAYAHALAPFCQPLSDDALLARLGGPPERVFLEMIPDRAQVAEALRRLREISLQYWKLIQPFDGMLALIDELHGAACTVGVWTGRERESTEWLLHEHGLRGKLDALVCGDDMPSHKPDPAGLAEVLRRLGVARSNALFVGDADVDVVAGGAIDVRTLLIRHGRAVNLGVLAQAWRVVDTPAEAYAVLRAEVIAGGSARPPTAG